MSVFFRYVLLAAGFVVAGCQTPPVRDPEFAPVQPANLMPPPQNNGAIYQANYDMRLFEDHTARRVGDILTIRLVERTQARKQSDTSLQKNTEMSATAPSIWGMAAASVFGHNPQMTLQAERDFQGEGESNQSNSLIGDITVTVTEVLPNGNLRVRGEKRVTLNQGDEFVRISGLVRPVDIDAANTVLSTRVADATIMYTGEGALADANRVGWLGRVLMSPWFPF